MALQKQGIQFNFAQGLDTKTDPNQVQLGKMLSLQNAIFTKGGLLQKRNGFGQITTLPNTDTTTLTTLNGNLTAVGNSLYAFSQDTAQWLNQGPMPQVNLNVIPLSRDSFNESQVDAVVTDLGLTCTSYLDGSLFRYSVLDSNTGQAIVNKVLLPSGTLRARTFLVGNFFVIVCLVNVGGTFHIKYVPIPIFNPTAPFAAVDVSSQAKNGTDYFDGVVTNNTLYFAFNASDGGGAIRAFKVDSHLNTSAPNVLIAAHTGNQIFVTADESMSSPTIWVGIYDATSHNAFAAAFNEAFLTILAPTAIFSQQINNMTAYAINGILTFLYEANNTYPASAVLSDFITKNTLTQAGVLGSPTIIVRSVGLASKVFLPGYFLAAYNGAFQPSYFLLDVSGHVIAKIAYSNGGGYPVAPLPSVTDNDATVYIPYLIKDFLAALNRTQGATSSTPIYSQTGVNLAKIQINQGIHSVAEISNVLNITGGFLWEYDGVLPVEQGFHLFPEDIIATPSTAAGSLTAQQYFYQVTYEWTDNVGNLIRSAPSIPVGALVVGGENTVTLQIPTLRLTYKDNVRIVIYRWSTAQQSYYQITSITSPLLSDPTVDTVSYVDLQADSAILGNNLIYTTGGVLENIAAPACYVNTLYKSRLWVADAEDRNLLWYSKQVLEDTPVEMSDLQTIYVAPSASANGSSGPITALSSMDDKLIIYKADAIYYITGNGPDATGANNDFSDPILITSTIGCSNPASIVFSPIGLMFQSDKGIWLLGRDLSTKYVGAAVELYNSTTVLSGLTIPATNQVRFNLDSGVVLMYDYYYEQWGTFNGVSAISSTLYQGLHTFINILGQVFQETPSVYLDGTSPVLLQFSSAWIKLTGLQGFQRAYHFFILGNYLSPHKLNVTIAYDYDPSFTQSTMIMPTNFNPTYGSDPLYGDLSPYGGPGNLEQWRVFLNTQKCESIQVSIQEVYDSTFGVVAGAGFTLSGLNMVIGTKLDRPKLTARQSV